MAALHMERRGYFATNVFCVLEASCVVWCVYVCSVCDQDQCVWKGRATLLGVLCSCTLNNMLIFSLCIHMETNVSNQKLISSHLHVLAFSGLMICMHLSL